MENIEGIDEFDKKILKSIQHDARKSYSDIGNEVGLTRVAVKNRMNALKERGIIREYQTVINPCADPNGIQFFIDIEADPEQMEAVIAALASFRFNRKIYTTSGESHIHVIGFAPNNATYNSYVSQVFMRIKGVRRIICSQVLVTHKDVDGGIDYVRHKEPENMEGI